MHANEQKKKQSNMKWSEFEGAGTGCKQHPNNKQLPGVCSYCLREKLSKLCKIKPTYPSPPPSSSPPQSFSSKRHCRHTSSVTDSVSSMISFNYGLKKSKSIAFASRSQLRDREVNGDNKGSKKGSFWSKLLKLTRKDTKEAFMHSRTMREGKGSLSLRV